MPLIKSAIKKMRKDVAKTMQNLGQKSNLKTLLAKAIKTSDKETVTAAVSALDTAAKKNIIHRNTASRKKAKLMRLLTTVKVESAPKAKPKTKKAKKTKAKK